MLTYWPAKSCASLQRSSSSKTNVKPTSLGGLPSAPEAPAAPAGAFSVTIPGFAAAALEGRDIRPGAAPLPARSRTEVDTWLELHWFPTAGRKFVDAPLPDGPVLVRAHADESFAPWQAQEAAEKGISGVPTFVFMQQYAVSGAQDPALLARAIRKLSAEINAEAAE